MVAAINGKIELVYEGEQEGSALVAQGLISKALRNHFATLFPDPSKLKKKKQVSPYQKILDWFSENNVVDLMINDNDKTYCKILDSIPALEELINQYAPNLSKNEKYVMKEFILHGLAEHSQLGKATLEKGLQFKDLFGSILSGNGTGFSEEELN